MAKKFSKITLEDLLRDITTNSDAEDVEAEINPLTGELEGEVEIAPTVQERLAKLELEMTQMKVILQHITDKTK